MSVHLDGKTLDLAGVIDKAISSDEPFDCVLAALELVLASRIAESVPAGTAPGWEKLAASLVHRHVSGFLENLKPGR